MIIVADGGIAHVSVLAESVEALIGVDTHRDTLAAVVTPIGAVSAKSEVTADTRGYHALFDFGRAQAQHRCWDIDGAGSYGAGLACVPNRTRCTDCGALPAETLRTGRKNDEIDAVRAACEALNAERLIEPRRRGERDALRVLRSTRASAVTARTRTINHLKSLIVAASEALGVQRRGKTSHAPLRYCSQLRARPGHDGEYRMTVQALHSTAQCVLALRKEADELEREITELVTVIHPELLAQPDIGAISPAQVLIS